MAWVGSGFRWNIKLLQNFRCETLPSAIWGTENGLIAGKFVLEEEASTLVTAFL